MTNPANSAVHIILRRGSIDLAVGSGVLYQRHNKIYVVTAWHNVTGRHSETLKCLSSNQAIPNNAYMGIARRVSTDSYAGYTRLWMTVPLEEDGKPIYYVHPQGWPRVDVVVIPIDPQRAYTSEYKDASGKPVNFCFPLVALPANGSCKTEIHPIQDAESKASSFCDDTSAYLYASEDLFILGYPKGITDQTGQPVWKRASVASEPHLGWNNQPMFLVDCASKEGMSGAPVIFHNHKGVAQLGSTTYIASEPVTIFHGIYVGRLGSTSEFEAQLGCVWKRSVIDEIIDSEELGAAPDELRMTSTEILDHIKEHWPQSDSTTYAQSILDVDSSYIHYFTYSIMEKINGRSSLNDVRQLVKSYAEQLLGK